MTLLAESSVSYLHIYLEPFAEFLGRPDVTDIYLNRPGELWVETLGGQNERFVAPELTESLLWRLARQVASITHQGISREHPLLAATLPGGERIQIIAPPATRGPMALAIRKHRSADLSLDDFDAAGAFSSTIGAVGADPVELQLKEYYDSLDWSSFLKLAVRNRKTLVVAGGTSTGKTTFLNALLREIEPHERLIAIEDTPELDLRQENSVGLLAVRGSLGEAQASADDLLIASLRMRPDRIILGEVRGIEAFTFLRAVNVGHPGSLTTIHADTPEKGVDQLALLVLQSGRGLRRQDIVELVEASVDIFVQLERRGGQRRVSQIRWSRAQSL